MRWVRSFVLPGGVIVLAAVVASFLGLPARLSSVLLPWYPLVPVAAGVLLGLRFGQGRAVGALAALAAATWAMMPSAYYGPGPGRAAAAAFAAAGILLPVDIALFALLREKGVFTLQGLGRLGFLGVQPFFAAGAYLLWPSGFDAAVTHSFTSSAAVVGSGVPQPALAALFFAFVVGGLGVVLREGPVETAFLWSLVPVSLALSQGGPGPVSAFYLAVAGLVLAAAIVEAAYGMAFRDRLTGLPSRRALEEAMAGLNGRFTLAMVDVDHFKRFNDRYGHDVGDQVLKMVSSRLARTGGGGRAFRYGGEEFALIFTGMSTEEAAPHLDALRKTVAAANFTLRGPGRPGRKPRHPVKTGRSGAKVSVTVSIGAAWAEAGGADPWAVIKAADQSLLRAKKAGRNKVETWKG